MSKKKTMIIFSLTSILLIIVAFVAGRWFQKKQAKPDDTSISIEEINEKASACVSQLKEPTESKYVSIFDKYNEVKLVPNSVESVEESLYKGLINITAPNFEEGFNSYAESHGDDSFTAERYDEILEEILTTSPIVSTEHEVYLYLNENSELIPILDDDIINSMYGNIKHLYMSEFENFFQNGGE